MPRETRRRRPAPPDDADTIQRPEEIPLRSLTETSEAENGRGSHEHEGPPPLSPRPREAPHKGRSQKAYRFCRRKALRLVRFTLTVLAIPIAILTAPDFRRHITLVFS